MATVKILPAKLGYKITRGDDFADPITFTEDGDPIDVSARTYTAQIRRTTEGEVEATMSVDMTDAATGVIVLTLADSITEDMDGSYVWDLEQDTAGVLRTILAGPFEVLRDVTRD
jgi:hypothetical protein